MHINAKNIPSRKGETCGNSKGLLSGSGDPQKAEDRRIRDETDKQQAFSMLFRLTVTAGGYSFILLIYRQGLRKCQPHGAKFSLYATRRLMQKGFQAKKSALFYLTIKGKNSIIFQYYSGFTPVFAQTISLYFIYDAGGSTGSGNRPDLKSKTFPAPRDSLKNGREAWWQASVAPTGTAVYRGRITFSFKCVGSGKLNFTLRGIYKKDQNGKAIPYWIDYTGFKINEKIIFSERKSALHDKPIKYSCNVKDGDITECSAA